MKFQIKVKPRAKRSRFEKIEDGQYRAFLQSAPEKGQANEELVDLISQYFKVAKRRVGIVSGLRSKTKIVEII